MKTSRLENIETERNMERKHSTVQSKSNKIINFLIFSGEIHNRLYKDGKRVSETEITSSPESAFFDKEGKLVGLCALWLAYDKHKPLRLTGGLLIQRFFDSNVTLRVD